MAVAAAVVVDRWGVRLPLPRVEEAEVELEEVGGWWLMVGESGTE